MLEGEQDKIKENFEVQIEGWGTFNCEFGQVACKGLLNGFARMITQKGCIFEGQYKNGSMHGWQRMIYSDRDYVVCWMCSNLREGYHKWIDGKSGKTIEEVIYVDNKP